jgi:hypothetical protein
MSKGYRVRRQKWESRYNAAPYGERERREAQAANESSQAANEKRFSAVTRNLERLHDSIKRLERIAVAHEQRLDDLEGGEQD